MAQLLSIAIEDSEIKLLVVEGKGVKTAVSSPLEPGLVKDGVVLDKAAVSQKIRQLLETHKVSARKVVASISGIHSVYRLISLPRLPGELLAEAVKREAARIMPVPVKELYLSWQPLPVSREETLVALVGLPRGTVDALIDSLRQAGLTPYLMDVRPLAAARAAGETRAIVVNVEAADFDIVILVDGIPQLVRSLAFSQDDLLPSDKAMEIKEELERTVGFYNASHEAEPLREDMPVIFGGDARVSELLRQELPSPTKPFTAPLSHAEDFSAGNFMTNIGLVLKELKVDQIPLRLNLNAVPEVYLPKPVPILPVLSSVVILVAIGLLVWLGFTARQAVAQTSALRAELSQVQAAIKAQQVDPKKISELEARLRGMTAARDSTRKAMTDWEKQRLKLSGDLGKATSLLPGKVTIPIGFTHGTALTVEGVAPDKDTILSYAKSLQATGGFTEVLITFDTKEYGQLNFKLTLK